jgi:hypothetical protein
MSTSELLDIVRKRGLRIVLENGRPVLKRANREQVTDSLLAVLKVHRERIIKMLEERGE